MKEHEKQTPSKQTANDDDDEKKQSSNCFLRPGSVTVGIPSMEEDLHAHAPHHGVHASSADAGQQQQQHALTLSLPGIHSSTPTSRSLKLVGADGGNEKHGREDCWSEGATFTLIEAWGDRYLELNRGNLKQKHWKDVADAVNNRDEGKAPKTDVQCKNRLDTLKKKYKLEKNKVATTGSSKWVFFEKLDELIGTSRKLKKAAKSQKRKKDRVDDGEPKALINNNNNASTNTKSKESPDMTDSCPHGTNPGTEAKIVKKKKLQDGPFKDLARAIIKFGEVYERIESAKQQQLMDLEKQRMEFTKELEIQRMQLFMQTQVELAKMKHAKHGSTATVVLIFALVGKTGGGNRLETMLLSYAPCVSDGSDAVIIPCSLAKSSFLVIEAFSEKFAMILALVWKTGGGNLLENRVPILSILHSTWFRCCHYPVFAC
ncbi:hypothetical protein R1sor_023259 [Riccia sorocarpa]|uniref:Myb/SANT-like DNA-binding domain-containing protein n=1 Tax=Riccia sorocarpa TaxID=122646 RepID=A0ABD3GMX7_9MARC